MISFRRALAIAALVLTAAACSSGSDPGSEAERSTPSARASLTVFAASSLTGAFNQLGHKYSEASPNVTVAFDFESSTDLARKINDGAPADVFVSADEPTMDTVVGAGNAFDPRVVARNRLQLLTAKGNPKHLTGLADLSQPGVVFDLCAPEVPCGRLGALALRQSGVSAEPASLEPNVKAVVSRVTSGEADAGIVYVTDARGAEAADAVDIAVAGDPALEAVYPAAVVRQSTYPDDARRFIDYVLSPDGQAVLRKFGFRHP